VESPAWWLTVEVCTAQAKVVDDGADALEGALLCCEHY